MNEAMHEPLSEEEARWAARLAQLPDGEPGAELDARIRSQARAALRRRPLPWWGGALAAALALGVGVRVLLAPVGIEAPAPSESATQKQQAPGTPSQAAAEMQTAPETEMDSVTVTGSRVIAVPESDAGSSASSDAAPPVAAPQATEPSASVPVDERRRSLPPARKAAERVPMPQAFPAAPPPRAAEPYREQQPLAPTLAPAPLAAPPAPPAAGRGTVDVRDATQPAARAGVDREEAAPALPPSPALDATPSDRAETVRSTAAKRVRPATEAPARTFAESDEQAASAAAGHSAPAAGKLPTPQTGMTLDELIHQARRWHAEGDVRALTETLRRIEREHPEAVLPEDVRGWLEDERARR
jgi:hypothetical protein